jgi:hypothetical protein
MEIDWFAVAQIFAIGFVFYQIGHRQARRANNKWLAGGYGKFCARFHHFLIQLPAGDRATFDVQRTANGFHMHGVVEPDFDVALPDPARTLRALLPPSTDAEIAVMAWIERQPQSVPAVLFQLITKHATRSM